MKRNINYLFYTIFLVSLFSCKKQTVEVPKNEKYIQYFKADIAGQTLDLKSSIDENRDLFRGSYTEIGFGDGTFKEMYTVNVAVPNTLLNTSIQSKLQFQLFDIKKGVYQLSNDDSYQKDFSSHIYLVTNLGMQDSKLYTTNEKKPPFNISITRYEKVKGSMIPFVGGKLNGVLYNVKDLKDSIVIDNGVFDVRY